MANHKSRELTAQQRDDLLRTLQARFEANRGRHTQTTWQQVQERLEAKAEKLWSLHEMEKSGGEPDVMFYDPETGEIVFCDCSVESPAGRRNLCYDQAALEARKANKPEGSAMDTAERMGIEMLTEEAYRALQQTGAFDTKTSSWIVTPEAVRALGGALFGDRRYDHVFIYHNGADSYYAVRGFRGMLRV